VFFLKASSFCRFLELRTLTDFLASQQTFSQQIGFLNIHESAPPDVIPHSQFTESFQELFVMIQAGWILIAPWKSFQLIAKTAVTTRCHLTGTVARRHPSAQPFLLCS
jgi:hypothetical protein